DGGRWTDVTSGAVTRMSPAVVREGLVRLGHLVGVLAALDRRTETVARVEQLVHQALGHRLLATGPAVLDQPAQAERGAGGGAGPLRGMSALLLLRAVPAASLLAVPDALGVQRAADDLVAHAGEVLHAAAAHEHHRVLLQVVADARDVGGHLDATGEADTSDL